MLLKCFIDDKKAELLAKHFPSKTTSHLQLETLDLRHNNITIAGLVHILNIVKASEHL